MRRDVQDRNLRNWRLLCGFVCFFVASVTFAAEWVIVHAGELMAVPGEQVKKKQSVVVKDGIIASVEDGYRSRLDIHVAKADSVRVIDLRSGFVLPGLIDGHVHFSGNYSERSKLESVQYSSARISLNAASYARDTLMAGFTAVRDLGGNAEAVFSLRDVINNGSLPGPRIVAVGDMISGVGGHADIHGYSWEVNKLLRDPTGLCDGPFECRRSVRSMVHRGADAIKLAVTGGVTSDIAAGTGTQLFEDELVAIVDTAHMLGRRVSAHAHGAEGIKAALRAGVDSIEHGTFVDDEGISLFLSTESFLVPTFSAGRAVQKLANQEGTFLPAAVIEKVNAVVPAQIEKIRKAHKAGVKIAFGSDAGVFPHGDNAEEFIYMVEAGMSPQQAIVAATVNAAQNIGLSEEIGTLATGKKADLIAVEGNPLKKIELLLDIPFVMKGGVVYKNDLRK